MTYYEVTMRAKRGGSQFQTYVWADTMEAASDLACEDYPEGDIIDITDPENTTDRQNNYGAFFKS